MRKTTMRGLITFAVFGACLLCGCGGKATSSEAWWLDVSDTVLKEEENTQASEEIVPGYQEFALLCGLSVEEVKSTLGQELTSEEDEFNNIICRNADGVEYWFYKDADALYEIIYTNMDAETAESFVREIYLEMRMRYGEDTTYPIENRIFDMMTDDMPKGLEGEVDEKHIEYYREAWRQPYNMRMEEKVKDYYATDKVTLDLALTTPYFMDQGSYCVSISHHSMALAEGGN